jgi:hypothetical protein
VDWKSNLLRVSPPLAAFASPPLISCEIAYSLFSTEIKVIPVKTHATVVNIVTPEAVNNAFTKVPKTLGEKTQAVINRLSAPLK